MSSQLKNSLNRHCFICIQTLTNNAELVELNGKKLQKQLEDRRKSRAVADTNIHAAVEGYEKRLNDLAQENDKLEEEVCPIFPYFAFALLSPLFNRKFVPFTFIISKIYSLRSITCFDLYYFP